MNCGIPRRAQLSTDETLGPFWALELLERGPCLRASWDVLKSRQDGLQCPAFWSGA